ncbi:MAG: hypothetical protein ACI9EF_001431 [Pseudohongiellaceae bacterium]|jgi:hypothetical protein
MLGDYQRAEQVLAKAIARDDDPLMLRVQRFVVRQMRAEREGSPEVEALVEEAVAELLSVAPDHPLIAELIARRQETQRSTGSEPP